MNKEEHLVLQHVNVKNEQDVDIFVKDYYGKEHIVFPGEEVDMILLLDNSIEVK